MRMIHALAALVAAGGASLCVAFGQDYQYSGAQGPAFWRETPGWEACGRTTEPGARQTPVDIRGAVFDRTLRPLALSLYPTKINVRNTGHTIEQDYEPGSYFTVDGAPYELVQFHFHTLSEHAVDGRRAAAELHAVFRNAATGRLAVVGQFFDLGKASPFLARLFSAGAPFRPGERIEADKEINVADAFVNTRAYYTYPGSLTTPPCSETVTWFVLGARATLSAEQYALINRATGNNFRPLEPLNGRVVRASFPARDD